MKRFRILPYRQGSKGAKALAEELGGKVLKLKDSKFVTKPDDMVINWGNTQENTDNTLGYWGGTKNNAAVIKVASNKLNFFRTMRDAGLSEIVPPWWDNVNDIPEGVYPVVCRKELAGHSGNGIVIASTASDLVAAPLYTQYLKKKDEYRVHVGRGSDGAELKIIAVQRKAVPTGTTPSDWKVRNHDNGFIYVRGGFVAPTAVTSAACRALEATSLDFGAVDVIFNEQSAKAYVLEINTAPGLEGQTVLDYAEYFRSLA